MELEDVAEVEDVGAVKVRRTITAAEVERVVPCVEEAEAALLIEGVGPGVGCSDLNSVTDAFVNVCLEGVVVVDTRGGVADGLGRVADVGNAEIYVAALIVCLVVRAVG